MVFEYPSTKRKNAISKPFLLQDWGYSPNIIFLNYLMQGPFLNPNSGKVGNFDVYLETMQGMYKFSAGHKNRCIP